METQALPDDMLFEIAQRCSTTETLATLRATSKSLALATYESKFTPLNLNSGFVIQTVVRNEFVIQYLPAPDHGGSVSTFKKVDVFGFLPLKVKINACSASMGVFYCESQQPMYHQGPKKYYVCKLATEEWIPIPCPKTKGDYCIGASGMVVMKTDPIKFKIIRLSTASKLIRKTGFASHTCQVYDSEKPYKWRTLENDVHLAGDTEFVNDDTQMVTVNGNLHLLVGRNRILVFDTLTDEWNFIPTPKEYPNLHPKIFNDQGKLNFIVEESTLKKVTLWIMKDYKNKVWIKSCVICTKPVLEIDHLASVSQLLNYERGLFTACYAILHYHFGDGAYEKQKLEYLNADVIFRFQSDFKKIGWESCADSQIPKTTCRHRMQSGDK